jgi:Protein of unknown function (DUF3016)
MSTTPRFKTALATALCLIAAQAFATTPGSSVVVSFRDPANFTDVDRDAVPRQAWLDDFAAYIERRGAAIVPAGDHLLVTVTDIQRAGLVKPGPLGSFHDIRLVRDETPPRVDLSFQLVTADGQVLKEGQRKLHDIDFLFHSRFHAGESSDHEKILVDDWLRQEFRPQKP